MPQPSSSTTDSSISNTKHCHSNSSMHIERLSISHATTPPTLLVPPQTHQHRTPNTVPATPPYTRKAKHFPQYHIMTHMIFHFHHIHQHHTLSQLLLQAHTTAKHFPQCHITTHTLIQFHHGLVNTTVTALPSTQKN